MKKILIFWLLIGLMSCTKYFTVSEKPITVDDGLPVKTENKPGTRTVGDVATVPMGVGTTLSVAFPIINLAINQVNANKAAILLKEPLLGNPGVTGYVLSSTTAGIRSWIAQSGGDFSFYRRNNDHDSLSTLQEKSYNSLTDKPTLSIYRMNNDHDSLNTLQEKSYNSLTDKPVLTIYRQNNDHDSLSTLQEKSYNSLTDLPTLTNYRSNNDHDSLNNLQEKSYNSLNDKPDLTIYRRNNNHDSLSTLDEKSYNSLNDKPTLTVYRQNNDHDSLSTLQEKNYSSLDGKPTFGTAAAQDVGYFAPASHSQAQSTITALSDSLLVRYTKTQSNNRYSLLGHTQAQSTITGLADSLLNHYTKAQSNAKYSTGTGTVTSIATGLGLSGGTISTTGTILVDTANASILSRQRAVKEYVTDARGDIIEADLANYVTLDSANGSGAINTYVTGKDFNTDMALKAASSHAHGNITNTGYVGSTANIPLITGTSGIVQAGSFGTGATNFTAGNDARLSDARTPVSHAHGNITNAGAIGTTATLPVITTTSGVLTAGSFGTSAGTFTVGNDSRLSDARTPSAHTQAVSTISDATTIGQNLVKLTNPSAITFPRINANNTLDALSASNFLTAIGAGVGDVTLTGTQTLTNKTLTSPKINENVALTATSTQLDAAITDLASYATLDSADGSGAANTYVSGKDFNVASALKVDKATMPTIIGIACSDEATALTASTSVAKVTFRMPYAMTVTAVRASVTTAPTNATILVDIHESGTTILSTKIMIDATELTSTTAATGYVIADAALADDASITVFVDQIGSTVAGAGLKIWIIGTRVAP